MAQWKSSLQKAQRPGIHSRDHSKQTNKQELLQRRPQTPAFSTRSLEAVHFLSLMNTSRNCSASHTHAYSSRGISLGEIFFRTSSADTQVDEIYPSTESPGSHGGLFSFGEHVLPMELQLCSLTNLSASTASSVSGNTFLLCVPGAQFLPIPRRSESPQWLSLDCFTEQHSLALPVLLQAAGFPL